MARGVPADDLPLTADQRKFLGLPAVPKSQRQRKRPSRAETGPPTPGRCAVCDWRGTDHHDGCDKPRCNCFVAHMFKTGHIRFEVLDL